MIKIQVSRQIHPNFWAENRTSVSVLRIQQQPTKPMGKVIIIYERF